MRHVLVLALLASASAAAAQQKPTGAPPGSAIATIEQSLAVLDSLDADLAKVSRRLSTLVLAQDDTSPTLRTVAYALGAQAATWRRYRAAECGLIGAMTGAGGSWPSAWALICEVEQTTARLALVRSAAVCVEAQADDERVYDDGQCLREIVAFRDPRGSATE